MSIFRIEIDPQGNRTEIAQIAYQTPDGIQVRDADELVPDHWLPFEPDPNDAPVIVPDRVTMRQARLALLGAGLLDDVESAITSMGDTPEGKAARIEWDYSSEMHRNKTFVNQLGSAIGLSSEQIDQLFIAAAGIE